MTPLNFHMLLDEPPIENVKSPGAIPFHELANWFPLVVEGPDAEAMCADIGKEGLREPIVLHAGAILEGRTRYTFLIRLGMISPDVSVAEAIERYPVLFRAFDPDVEGDAQAWVLSKNLHRRHLNESQRGLIAERLATRKGGRPSKTAPKEGLSVDEAADRMNVGTPTVERARVVRQKGAPELYQAVAQGAIALTPAAEIAAELPIDEQKEIVAKGEKEILAKAKEIRGKRAGEKREKRVKLMAEVTQKNVPLPDRLYSVIYWDPPWEFTVWGEGGMDRAAGNHYQTMMLDHIVGLNAGRIAADDCIMFMWATVPNLVDAIKLGEACGFKYKSHSVWDKEWRTTGYWFVVQHELLLVFTKGNPPCPLPGTQEVSVYRERRTIEHSRKPEFFLDMIDRHYPDVPKIELFQRAGVPVRPGWDVWGNQSETAEAEAVEESNAGDKPDALVDATLAAGLEANAWVLSNNRTLGDYGIGKPHGAPWDLPSRLFAFPIEFVERDRIEADESLLLLNHPEVGEHPYVLEVEHKLGIKIAWEPLDEFGRDRGDHLWFHAVDLCTDEHFRGLIETLQFTDRANVMRAVIHALGYGTLSPANARELLSAIESAEPVGRSAKLLAGKGIETVEITANNSGKALKPPYKSRPSFPITRNKRDVEKEAWMLIHGIEDAWFSHDRSRGLVMSVAGMERRTK